MTPGAREPRRREPTSEEVADVPVHEDAPESEERCETCGEVVPDVGMFGCSCETIERRHHARSFPGR